MAAATANNVNNGTKYVNVWEFRDNLFQWIPYSADICLQLDRACSKNLTSLFLGDIDPQLYCYSINFVNKEQTRKDTGAIRPVQQKQYAVGSCPGQGVYWQWLEQPNWCLYSVNIQDAIEVAYQKGARSIDLEQFTSYLPHIIDFSKMTQVRKVTRNARPVRRITGRPYPVAKCDSSTSTPNGIGHSASQNIQSNAASGSIYSASIPGTSSGYANGNGKLQTDINGASAMDTTTPTGRLMSWIHSKLSFQMSDPTSASSPSKTIVRNTHSKLKIGKSRSFTRKSINRKPIIVDSISRAQYKLTSKSIIDKYTKLAELTEKEDCPICCDDLSSQSSYANDGTARSFVKCGHSFHRACLEAMIDNSSSDTFVQCPTCKEIYGIKIGIQPPGEMKYYSFPKPLPGFDCDTICIVYNFKSGYQSEEHPHPGRQYSAQNFPRTCYLPNNNKGRQILSLLCVAWQRHLIFTIGTSVTTGANNVVTWNEIHHKTEFGNNYSGHGYPDDKYFDNVLLELAAQGVTEDDDNDLYKK